MLLEKLKAKARPFKAFTGEYVMIVVSIVTALALENGVRYVHQAREAQEAARNLDAEIVANIAELRSAIAHNSAQVDKTKKLKAILLADIKAGVSDSDAIRHVARESGEDFGVSIETPSLQREAWDVAVANQALSNMPAEQLQHYARQYAGMRDVQALLAGKTTEFLDMSQLSNTFSSIELGDLKSRDMYRIFTQMGSLYHINTSVLRDLEKLLVEEQQKTLKLVGR
jgi:hypothetical protein